MLATLLSHFFPFPNCPSVQEHQEELVVVRLQVEENESEAREGRQTAEACVGQG